MPLIQINVPKSTKNIAMTLSLVAREIVMCQGEMAKKSEASKASNSCLKSVRMRKKKTIILAVPKRAAGRRTASALSPRTATKGISR